MNYIVTDRILEGWNKHDRDRFLHLGKLYIWDDPYLFKYCSEKIVRRCVTDYEVRSILSFCYDQACGGHFSRKMTTVKVLQCGFFWLTLFKDACEHYWICPRYQ